MWVLLFFLCCCWVGSVSASGFLPEVTPWNCSQRLPGQTSYIRYVSPTLRRVALDTQDPNCAEQVQFILYDTTFQGVDDTDVYIQLSTTFVESRCEATLPLNGSWSALAIGLATSDPRTLLMQFEVASVSETGLVTFARPCPYDGPTNTTRVAQCLTQASCNYETGLTLPPAVEYNATHMVRSLPVTSSFCIHPESARVFERITSAPTLPPTMAPTPIPASPLIPPVASGYERRTRPRPYISPYVRIGAYSLMLFILHGD
jgi:hypothetical protein